MVAKGLALAVIVSAALLFPAECIPGDSQEASGASLRIVYNNIPGDPDPDLKAEGGFGAWVEIDGKAILFDAGGDASILMDNLRAMSLDRGRLEAVVISHNHWDHVYGLPVALGVRRLRPEVHVPEPARALLQQQIPGANLVAGEKSHRILDGVWSVGPIQTIFRNAPLSEQALVVKRGEGIYVLTGCAHPGIVGIVEKSKELFPDAPILLVAGGFHLMDHTEGEIADISAAFRRLGVKRIAPSHCTGEAAIEHFRREWKEDFLRLYLGDEVRF